MLKITLDPVCGSLVTGYKQEMVVQSTTFQVQKTISKLIFWMLRQLVRCHLAKRLFVGMTVGQCIIKVTVAKTMH